MEIKSNKRISALLPTLGSGVMSVKYSACTLSVLEDTWCCARELRERFSVSEKTNDPGPCLPCRRRPHASPLRRQRSRGPRPMSSLGLSQTGSLRDRLFRNGIVLIAVQPVKEAHGDDGTQSRSNIASSCNVWLLQLGLTGVLSFCHRLYFHGNYLSVDPRGRSQRDWHLKGIYFSHCSWQYKLMAWVGSVRPLRAVFDFSDSPWTGSAWDSVYKNSVKSGRSWVGRWGLTWVPL